MVAKNLAFPFDEISGRDYGVDDGSVVRLYWMRGRDNGDASLKYWISTGFADYDAISDAVPALVGTLENIRVIRITESVANSSSDLDYVWAWNSLDVSQFTLVRGNGVGGHGVAGDHVISRGTFPNDDAPAIVLTTPGTTNHALWLFNDFAGPAPTSLRFCWRGLNGTLDSHREGFAFYYEDTDHWLMALRTDGSDLSLGAYQTSFSARPDFGKVADVAANRDTTYGDTFAANVHYRVASGVQKPWAIARAGGHASAGYGETGLPLSRTTAFGDGSAVAADASWTGIGSYAPRMGLFVEGGGVAGTMYIGGLSVRRAYGGV